MTRAGSTRSISAYRRDAVFSALAPDLPRPARFDRMRAMKSYLLAAALATALAATLAAPALADLKGGVAAYEQGDYAAALAELRPLAQAGSAEAQYVLGTMYDLAMGVARDPARALEWYRKAARQRWSPAQYMLGLIYAVGQQGVPQDYVQAHMWLDIAAAQGVVEAARLRDRIKAQMTPAQVLEAQREAGYFLGTMTKP
jgi:hypothetical protein